MNSPTLLAVQVGIPLLLGIAATSYLREVTRHLLADICGTDDRAEFWVRITAIMTTATPMVLVLLFGHTLNGATMYMDTAYLVLRQTLWLSLVGIIGAVGILARTIWRQIPQHQVDAVVTAPARTPVFNEELPCAS